MLLRYGSIGYYMKYYPNDSEDDILKALNLFISEPKAFESEFSQILALQDLTDEEIKLFESTIKASTSDMDLPGDKAHVRNRCEDLVSKMKSVQLNITRLFCIVMPKEVLLPELFEISSKKKLYLTQENIQRAMEELNADSRAVTDRMKNDFRQMDLDLRHNIFDECEKVINEMPIDLAKDNGVSYGLTLYGLSKIREAYTTNEL